MKRLVFILVSITLLSVIGYARPKDQLDKTFDGLFGNSSSSSSDDSGDSDDDSADVECEGDTCTFVIPSDTTSTSADGHTASEVIAMWNTLKSDFTGTSYYEITPSAKKPYKAGKLKKAYLKEALAMLNFARYLAGIPYDVVLDDDLNDMDQHGAVLLQALDELTHYPSQPSNMDDDFYELGYDACSSANIAWNYGTLEYAVKGWLSDSGTTSLGHRRWILNPQMKKIGFGHYDEYLLMHSFDYSRTETFDYDYIAWPAEGDFPMEMFHSYDLWSISFNSSKFSAPTESKIKITVTRESDSKTWNLSSSDSSTSGEYLSYESLGYGSGYCIAFRPNISSLSSGDSFDVKIIGIKDKSGASTEIEYSVTFIDMDLW